MSFLSFWTDTLWPKICHKYGSLLDQRPLKQDEADGTHYGECVYKRLESHGSVKNVSCNLSWTDPTANTMLMEDISLAMVENFVIDTFVDQSVHEPQEGPLVILPEDQDSSQDLTVSGGVEGVKTARDTTLSKKRKWRVPAKPPQFMHIPIIVKSTTQQLEKGHFPRFGMDYVVNGVWLALYWAMEDADNEAISALEKLILN